MLSIRSAAKPLQHKKPRIGLAIAGGGPLGGIYELGALLALDELLEDRNLVDFDVFVGVSSGAFIAAGMANAMDTATMSRIFINAEEPDHPFKPELFMQPAFREYLKRAGKVPGIVAQSIWAWAHKPLTSKLTDQLGRFGAALPTGFLDNSGLAKFLKEVFNKPGRSNDFRELEKELYLVAVDLDNGGAVRFGSEGFDDVPISTAVQASAALPGLYPPVEIKGRHYVDGVLRRTLHASIALKANVDLVIGINPLVPFDADHNEHPHFDSKRIIDGGLPSVISQTLRAMIQSRMQIGLDKNSAIFEHADLVLLEPDRNDAEMFFTNVFSYSGRKRLCEHAYQTTRAQLRKSMDRLQPVLARNGLKINTRILDEERSVEDALLDQHPNPPMLQKLRRTLRQLEREVAQA